MTSFSRTLIPLTEHDLDETQRYRQVEGDNLPRTAPTWPEDRVAALRWRIGEWIARIVVVAAMLALSDKYRGPWFGG